MAAADPRIRRLSVRDTDAVLAFLQAQDEQTVYFFEPHPFDRDHVERLLGCGLSGQVAAFGAFVDGGLAGYAWLWDMQSDTPSLGICVAKAHRGRRVGRALMDRCVEEAILRCRREIRLCLVPTNTTALRLYESVGFRVTGEHTSGERRFLDMARSLPTGTPERAAVIRRHLAGCRIALVPYCHPDWAWVHTRHWHERRYVRVFEDVLEILREDPSFRWYMDNAACQLAPLLNLRPDLLPELQERVREGRIAICGAYSNVRPQMVGDETFARNLTIGRSTFAGLFPGADLSVHADAVDVAAGHPQLPQLLTQAGYRYLRIWRPYGALSLKGIPNELVWRGLDGSAMLVARGIYGGLWSVTPESRCLLDPVHADWDAVVAALWDGDLEERARYSVVDQVWLAHGSDDGRPCRLIDDTPIDVRALVRLWNERELAPMRFATPVEAFAVLDEQRDELPVVSGTLDPCDVAYNAAWNGEKGLAVRRIENDRRLVEAETFAALAGGPYPEAALEALWRDHLLTCAHATQWLYVDDFAEMSRRADWVQLGAEGIRDDAIDTLVRAAALPDDAACVVFNTLPFARRMVVETVLSQVDRDRWPTVLCDSGGRPLAQQAVRGYVGQGGYEERRVIASVEVPALGFTALREMRAVAGPGARAEGDMDNGRLRLVLDGGAICGVADHASGHVWDAPPGLPWGALTLYRVDTPNGPLHVGPITEEVGAVWDAGRVTEAGPVRWTFRRQGAIGPHPAALEARLVAGEPRVDLHVEVDWQGEDGFLALRAPLPADARLLGDIPFGVEEKDIASEPYLRDHMAGMHSMERTREGLFYARSFVACERPDGRGFAFVAGNTDRYYRRGPGGVWLEHILLNSIATLDDWEQNVEPTTLFGRGAHRLRCSLLFYEGGWQAASVVRDAAAARRGPVVRDAARSPAGRTPTLPCERSLVAVEPEGVSLTALLRDGEDFLLRMHETHGVSTEAVVRLPWAAQSVQAELLSGAADPAAPAALRGDALTIALRPWQIVTVRLRR